jgi:spore germination protein PF
MPAIICGPIQINVISANGVVEFGDSLIVSPKTASKTPTGAGAFNTAIFALAASGVSGTNYLNPNAIDQPVAGNN